ncbi:hypothetical protein J5681_07665 [bacterium]|nr:hypothetical protein [bacterium]
MKKLFTLLSLILAMFVFVSCASDDEDSTDSDSASGKTCESSEDCPINYTCDLNKKICTKNPEDTGDTTPSDPTDTGDTTPSDPTDTGDTTPSDPTDTDNGDTGNNDPADSGDTGNNQPDPAPAACEISQSFKMSAYKDGEYYVFYGSGIVSDGNNNPTVVKEGAYTSLYTEGDVDYEADKTQSFITYATRGSGKKAIVVNTLGYDSTSHVSLNLTAIMNIDDINSIDQATRTADFAPEVEVLSVENFYDDSNKIKAQKFCTVAYSVMNSDIAEGKFQYCPGDDGTMNIGQTVKIGVDAKLTSNFEAIQAYFNEGLEESDPYFVKNPEDLCWCQTYASGATCE